MYITKKAKKVERGKQYVIMSMLMTCNITAQDYYFFNEINGGAFISIKSDRIQELTDNDFIREFIKDRKVKPSTLAKYMANGEKFTYEKLKKKFEK